MFAAGWWSAIESLLSSDDYAQAFGRDTVPYLRGLATSDGIPLETVNRTASLYGGNAGLKPGTQGSHLTHVPGAALSSRPFPRGGFLYGNRENWGIRNEEQPQISPGKKHLHTLGRITNLAESPCGQGICQFDTP